MTGIATKTVVELASADHQFEGHWAERPFKITFLGLDQDSLKAFAAYFYFSGRLDKSAEWVAALRLRHANDASKS